MINIKDIKNTLSTKDILEFYGVKFNQKDFAKCPFHNEKTASFKYFEKTDTYKCFSCGEFGDGIDFVEKYFNLNKGEALKKINADFNLGLDKTLSAEERKQYAEQKRLDDKIKNAENKLQSDFRSAFSFWTDVHRQAFKRGDYPSEFLGKLGKALDDTMTEHMDVRMIPYIFTEKEKRYINDILNSEPQKAETQPTFNGTDHVNEVPNIEIKQALKTISKAKEPKPELDR